MYSLKAQNRIGFTSSPWLLLVILLVIGTGRINASGQAGKSTVTLYSSDSLLITADEYVSSDTLPYVVLLHEQGSSRGEYSTIIHRFRKMNYNCLVPDLRNGGNSSFVTNETARRSRKRKYGKSVDDIEGDIRAAVRYATKKSGQPVALVGAGANGSLAMKAAKELDSVQAVIALSPGEYFRNKFSVEETLTGIEKPVLVVSSQMEYPYMKQLLSNVDDHYKELFKPETHEGRRGTAALMSENPSQGDYWLSILLFFKDLQ